MVNTLGDNVVPSRNNLFSIIFFNEPKPDLLRELQLHVITTGLCNFQLGPDFEISFSPTHSHERKDPTFCPRGPDFPEPNPLMGYAGHWNRRNSAVTSSETTSPF